VQAADHAHRDVELGDSAENPGDRWMHTTDEDDQSPVCLDGQRLLDAVEFAGRLEALV
jgi:hypothetical protein